MVAGCLCNPCQQPILWDRAHVLGVPLFPQGQYLLPREKTQATLWLTANPFGDIPLFPNRAHCTVSDGAVVPTVTARDKDPRLGQGSPKDGNSRTANAAGHNQPKGALGTVHTGVGVSVPYLFSQSSRDAPTSGPHMLPGAGRCCAVISQHLAILSALSLSLLPAYFSGCTNSEEERIKH